MSSLATSSGLAVSGANVDSMRVSRDPANVTHAAGNKAFLTLAPALLLGMAA